MARCNRCKCQNEAVECRKFCQYHLDLFKHNALKKPEKEKRITAAIVVANLKSKQIKDGVTNV